MLKTKALKNYVDLLKLKAEKIFQNKKVNIILNDDIWENETLLVKSGRYLTEDLINKLINFGIKKVNVDFAKKEEHIDEDDSAIPLNKFIGTQNILIIENNLLNAGWLVKNLMDLGFDKGNIFITADYNSINKYFKVKKINFIFTGLSTYEKCPKTLSKYSLLKNTHAFVLMEKHDSVRKINDNYSEIKFLKKPLNLQMFNSYINRALNQNLLDVYVGDSKIS